MTARSISVGCAALISASCAVLLSACDMPDHVRTVSALHEQILDAHRRRDPEAWTALEADTVLVASGGDVSRVSREERLLMRRDYLGSTRFSVYRDVRPPTVQVSRDGTMAWLMANVEVVAHRDAGAASDSSHTIWAWIELYERIDGRWMLVGNVSNSRSGSLP